MNKSHQLNKKCTRCGVVKHRDAYRLKDASTGTRDSWCRECYRETAKEYAQKKRDSMTPEQKKELSKKRSESRKAKQEGTGPYWKDLAELRTWIESL